MTVSELTERARAAAVVLAQASRGDKDAALEAMADALAKAEPDVLDANERDVERAETNGTSAALVDRLRLNPDRIAGMVSGLRDLARLPDPVGDVVRGWTNANGVQVRQIRVPFGVVGIIYEARPNVTADAGGICLKSGNAALLRGSSSAADSNAAIVAALRTGLEVADLPVDAIQLVPGPREVTAELMRARGRVDVLIPRGGAGLIDFVVQNSQVPVIETGVGNCHLYVDAGADQQMALDILVNAKTQRPSVCNAVETLLVHAEAAEEFLPLALSALARGRRDGARRRPGCPVRDPGAARASPTSPRSTSRSTSRRRWSTAWTTRLAHIRRYCTGHSGDDHHRVAAGGGSDSSAEVDAAAVLVNASSRFVDGGEFGFGAEIGISTQKLHARGPMGLPEMTSTKYVVTGDGQIR